MKGLRKNIAISLLLHTAAIFTALQCQHHTSKDPTPKKEKQQSEVELAPEPPKHHKIIPITTPSTLIPTKPLDKKGYYGIGVYIDPYHTIVICEEKQYVGLLITSSVEGYPANSLGITRGDVIIEVEGVPLTGSNDVVGPAPTTVNFTICRDHKKLFFTTIRAFIYND
jgi:hypothetical protein